ncbi:MAG: zinc-ribbon domain-containing protein, partial [Gemmataceae bacterium]|nr:zinc-ribbon domain-containing protein [Gemmataceae bacterium]
MSVRLSCPSCNTRFTLDALPEHRRATCTRCGDVFPVRGEVVENAGPAPVAPVPPAPPAKGGFWTMPRVALLVLLLVASGGMVWWGVNYVRENERQKQPPPPALGATPPTQLRGLGYLRPDCNVAMAVQPGPLLAYAERTGQDPRAVLSQTGLPDITRGLLDSLGLELAQVDHLVIGIRLGDDALRFGLVLVLKQPPADEDAFLAKLKAQPSPTKKGLYSVSFGRFPLGLVAERARPEVWCFALDAKDLTAGETALASGSA